MKDLQKILLMKPAETGQITGTNIYAVKNAITSMYFIKTNDGYIMFDAGLNTKKIETPLNKVNIDINDVKWIFLTHSDSDHVGALPFFPNAEIYMSRDELPLINGTAKRHSASGNKMPDGIDIDKITLLSGGQELSLGGTQIKCIQAPGHTTGSMLYLADNQYLFTGDAFMIRNGNISVHPFTMDSA